MSKYESMYEYQSENGFSESIKRPLFKTKNVSGGKVWPMVTFCLEIKNECFLFIGKSCLATKLVSGCFI